MDLPRLPKNLFDESELFSQFENQYYSQNEELKLYKNKCEELQQALEKVSEEKRELQLQLMTENTAKQQLLRNAENEKEAQQFECTAKLSSAQIETEHWKQIAEASEKEKRLLCEQNKTLQKQKTDTIVRLQHLQTETLTARKHRRSVNICIQSHKQSLLGLKKQFEMLASVKDQLVTQLEEQEKQVKMLNVAFTASNDQRKVDKAKISELEHKLIELNSTSVQEKQKAQEFVIREQETDALIAHVGVPSQKLKCENQNLHKSVVALSEQTCSSGDCNILVAKCQEVYQQIKTSEDKPTIVSMDFED